LLLLGLWDVSEVPGCAERGVPALNQPVYGGEVKGRVCVKRSVHLGWSAGRHAESRGCSGGGLESSELPAATPTAAAAAAAAATAGAVGGDVVGDVAGVRGVEFGHEWIH
jgi:hypothetical protein